MFYYVGHWSKYYGFNQLNIISQDDKKGATEQPTLSVGGSW